MAAKQKTLDDLFLDTLKDIYYAEKQILRALPKMAKAANGDELKQAFETHREQLKVKSNAWIRYLRCWASGHKVNPVTRSRVSSKKPRKSWRTTRTAMP